MAAAGVPGTPGVRDVIVENNLVENASVGLVVDAGVTGFLQRQNVFRDVALSIDDR
jgi:hypothetical protein